MGHWNYRVVHERQLWRIAEVYYDDDGNTKGWCEAAVEQDDEAGYLSLRHDLARMLEAFDKPPLTYDGTELLEVEIPTPAEVPGE